jgi:hypothetical protein
VFLRSVDCRGVARFQVVVPCYRMFRANDGADLGWGIPLGGALAPNVPAAAAKDGLMKFSEIANRVTGISTPVGGVSWQPAELEIAGARRVIAFLEDRRVLYEPGQMEVPSHCFHSFIEIRHCLTEELGKLGGDSELAASLRAMRAACRKFLERVGTER